mgnify:CR=1 FL=1
MEQQYEIYVKNLGDISKLNSTTTDLPTAINRVERMLRSEQYCKSRLEIRWFPGIRQNEVLVSCSLVYHIDSLGNTIIRTK